MRDRDGERGRIEEKGETVAVFTVVHRHGRRRARGERETRRRRKKVPPWLQLRVIVVPNRGFAVAVGGGAVNDQDAAAVASTLFAISSPPLHREANSSADALARHGQLHDAGIIFYEDAPSFHVPFLLADVMGVQSSRIVFS
ncbi:hypothetical protein PIB30_009739 [Stylosanthes scabra]|uniref:Uncharacterized protein n=1 Tax=Stylosanthes scabra TaxID=79078 RepID=A0ABU6W4U2_9FABA|nr:hypothetical protein [Stylosanthes scabra]